MKKIHRPELMAPAGSLEMVESAYLYGADAVYVGGLALNLRAKGAGFSFEEFGQALEIAKANGKHLYFCLNAFPREDQLAQVEETIEALSDRPPHAVIVADPGIAAMVLKRLPNVPLHVSTQANTTSSMSAAFWRDFGAKRVNLARETTGMDIKAIRDKCPDIELELFSHGAQCMAYSGRCFLSGYLVGRSSNQGLCAHPCRYDYKPISVEYEEELRPGGPLWEVVEDGQYSSFFAAEDLCLLPWFGWLSRMGIDALKIEGRTKSPSYLAQVCDALSTALNDVQQRAFHPRKYVPELENAASRPLTSGFFLNTPEKCRRITIAESGKDKKRPIVARILSRESDGVYRIAVKWKWETTQPVEMVLPGMNRPRINPDSYTLQKQDAQNTDVLHSGQTGLLFCDHPELRSGIYLRSSME